MVLLLPLCPIMTLCRPRSGMIVQLVDIAVALYLAGVAKVPEKLPRRCFFWTCVAPGQSRITPRSSAGNMLALSKYLLNCAKGCVPLWGLRRVRDTSGWDGPRSVVVCVRSPSPTITSTGARRGLMWIFSWPLGPVENVDATNKIQRGAVKVFQKSITLFPVINNTTKNISLCLESEN